MLVFIIGGKNFAKTKLTSIWVVFRVSFKMFWCGIYRRRFSETALICSIDVCCLNANVPVPSGSLSLRNRLLIFGIVCLVTLLIFLPLLHLSAQLNVSTSVISWLFAYWYHEFDVCSSYVFILFFRFIYFFLRRLLVLYFSLVAPVICYLFFLHVVLYVFLANKWWWWRWWWWWCVISVHTRGTQNISELSPTFTAHSKRVHEFDAFSSKC